MPRSEWPLQRGRPCVEIVLTLAQGGQPLSRTLLADTGAGSQTAKFEFILDEDDCLLCDGTPGRPVTLSGASIGSFPVYVLDVQIPALGFAKALRAVGVPSSPVGFYGIACFGFLDQFHYGNFAKPGVFGLES
jgi:hypothetical protein